MSDEVAFLRAERDYWRSVALDMKATLAGILAEAAPWSELRDPPEPPAGWRVGSFERREDGWHCAKETCGNCPCDWVEVVFHLDLSEDVPMPPYYAGEAS